MGIIPYFVIKSSLFDEKRAFLWRRVLVEECLTHGKSLDRTDRFILDRIQKAFPLVERPYRSLGEEIGISEEEVLSRVKLLKSRGIVRQISAIFHTTALGYSTSLVAMAVPEEIIEEAIHLVNCYPGVSHNYLRPGQYNVWFTIAVPPGEELHSVVEDIAQRAGGWPYLILPAVRKYKLAVILDVLEEGDVSSSDFREGMFFKVSKEGSRFPLSEQNIRIVRIVQEDLPDVERPFFTFAHKLGMSEKELIKILKDWIEHGWIRRFAAILNHRQAGFIANGMVVWHCPEEIIDEVGMKLAGFLEVSHCYHRPAYPPGWPYNLYAMVHGRTEKECHKIADKLSRAVRLPNYRVLFSVREFKKIRLKLFWDYPDE